MRITPETQPDGLRNLLRSIGKSSSYPSETARTIKKGKPHLCATWPMAPLSISTATALVLVCKACFSFEYVRIRSTETNRPTWIGCWINDPMFFAWVSHWGWQETSWGTFSVETVRGRSHRTSLPMRREPIGEEPSAPAKPVEITKSHDSPSNTCWVLEWARSDPIPVWIKRISFSRSLLSKQVWPL